MKNKIILFVLSLCILSLVLFVVYGGMSDFLLFSRLTPSSVQNLTHFNAFFNLLTSIFLVAGILFIKFGNKKMHIISMIIALISSSCFLVCYLVYHSVHGDTKFLQDGFIRYIYFFILISHIILSFVQVPLILSTVYFAVTKKFKQHKKIAKYTFPVWLYVSVSGVLVYIFLQYS